MVIYWTMTGHSIKRQIVRISSTMDLYDPDFDDFSEIDDVRDAENEISHISRISSTSTAVSREIAHLRSEIRHIADNASRCKEKALREKKIAENSSLIERKKQKLAEDKLKQVADMADQIRRMSDKKISASRDRVEQLKGELARAKVKIECMEDQNTKYDRSRARVQSLEDTLERLKAEKSKLMAEYQLERERRIRGENRLQPELDFENELQSRTQEIEYELKDKRKDMANLDRRLNERGEKLADVTVKMNEATKENIRMKKRLEKLNQTNKEINNVVAEKNGDLEKALDALKMLKHDIKTKSDLMKKKNDQIAELEASKFDLINSLDGVKHNERVQKDTKSDVERRLVVALQDHAIAQMTIKELEEKLSERVELFEGLREKVTHEVKLDHEATILSLREELESSHGRKDQLQGIIDSQTISMEELKSEKDKFRNEVSKLKSLSSTGTKEILMKTAECTKLTSEIAGLEKKFKELSKRHSSTDTERKSLKKINEALAKKLDSSQRANEDHQVDSLTMNRRNSSLLDEVKSLKAELRGKEDELSEEVAKVEGYRSQVNDLEGKMGTFDGQLGDHSQRVKSLEFDLKCKEKEVVDLKDKLSNEANQGDEINAKLESLRSKYLESESTVTQLKISLQTAELTSEAKQNHDERQREETLHLRKLNRKLDKELSMYKEILTTTSSTEAKNTERLVEMRRTFNNLNQQKLDVEEELQKFKTENDSLRNHVQAFEIKATNIKRSEKINNDLLQNTEVERLKIELHQERQRAIDAERQAQLLQSRLRVQADAEAESNMLSQKVINQLEKDLDNKASELSLFKSGQAGSSVGSNLTDQEDRNDPEVEGVDDIKRQIQMIRDSLEQSVSDTSTLMHEVGQFNVDFESFLTDPDQSHSDTLLIDDFKAKLTDIEQRLNTLPEDI